MQVSDRFYLEVLDPLMEKYRKDENYYFINEQGEKTFNSGLMMKEESDVFHPFFHPKDSSLITAFWVDDAPIIYIHPDFYEEKIDDEGGCSYMPAPSIVTPEWFEIIDRSKGRFDTPPHLQLSFYKHLFIDFKCDQQLRIDKKEAVT